MTPDRQFNPFAALLAWTFPGAGHIYLGQKHRGRYAMIGVLFLYVSGVFIGGIDSVDRRDDRLWFLAQGLCGPIAVITDYANQNWIKSIPKPELYDTIGINKPNEMGTLFSALAGLMNLIVILDAMFWIDRPEFDIEDRRKPQEGAVVRSP